MTIETKYNVGDTVYAILYSKVEEVSIAGFSVNVYKDVTSINYNVVSDRTNFDLIEDKLMATKKEAEKELDIQLSEGLEKDAKLLLKSWDEEYFELARNIAHNPNDKALLASKDMIRKCIADITGIINKNK